MKKINICMLTTAFALSLSLCACAGSDSDEVTANAVVETEVEESAADVVGETTAEVAENEEVVAEETVEEVEQNTQEVETFQSAGEWAHSVDRTEPKMTIWNEITEEGIILENEQKYILKEGDLLVICTKEKNNGLSIHSDISSTEYSVRSSSSYTQFIFNTEFLEETIFEVIITVAGTEYPFNVTLISESAADSASASTSEDTLSGKEWAATLEYDEPKLIVWNDEMGTKEVIDNGGEYQMQEGDVLGLYHGADYRPFTTEPYEFCEGFVMGMNFTILEGCNLPEESQTIDLGVEFSDIETGDFFTYYFTITTP